MKRIFFGLSSGLGPITRNAPVADKLKENGYQIYMSIYGEESMNWVKKLGYQLLIDDDPSLPSANKVIPPQNMIYDMDHYFAQMGLLDEAFTESWIRHRIEMLQENRVDLVIADMSPHTLIAAKVLGIPSISIIQSCYYPTGKRVNYWGDPPRNLPKVTPIMNRVLSKWGIAPIERMEELFEGDVDIVPGIPQMDPIHSDKVWYSGPISTNLLLNDVEPELNLKGLSILVYTGRLSDSSGKSGEHLLDMIIAAFTDKPVTVIIATSEPVERVVLPSNIRIVGAVPEEQFHVFDLFIHHGGHGSCLNAISRGVPSLIIATHTEREFNARQIHSLGCGEYLIPQSFTPDHLYELSMFMIHDNYRERIANLSESLCLKTYRGADLIYECAEKLLANGKVILE